MDSAEAPAHKLRIQNRREAQALLAQGARLVADYGGFQILEINHPHPEALQGASGQLRDDFNRIELIPTPIETTSAAAQARRKPVGQFNGKRLHLVQFVGPVRSEWRQAMERTGVKILGGIPQNAYLVYADATALAKLQTLAANSDLVQWDGPYEADYKLGPKARPFDAQGNRRALDTDAFTVQMVLDPQANAQTLRVIDQVKLTPVRQRETLLQYLNLTVRLAPDALTMVAAQPDVVSIHVFYPPRPLCERQAQIVAGNLSGGQPSGPGYLAWLASKGFTQAQFDNTGFVVDVTDSGVDNGTTIPNHFGLYVNGNEFGFSRLAYARLEGTANPGSTVQGCDGHGTINAHIIAGYDDGVGFPFADSGGFHYGLGICPFVNIGSSVVMDPTNSTGPNYTGLQSRAYRDGARISNNSWGKETAGVYDADCQEFDALVRDAQPGMADVPAPGNQEMVVVFAAGNEGPGPSTIDAPGAAKNVITVGASENVQPFGGPDRGGIGDSGADSADDIISFSSRGPCTDGRHKPDLCAPGTHVSGGVAQADAPATNGTALVCFDAGGVVGGIAPDLFFPANQQFYTASDGTSHAAPAVSGAAALLRQYFLNCTWKAPSPAMTKAWLMNTARYLTGTGANDTLWSDSQGMGCLDLGMALDHTARIFRDQLEADRFTASGQTRRFYGVISDPNKPFRVTLAWTDAPATTVPTSDALENDLDLTVQIGGQTYQGNHFAGASSMAGLASDSKNNVESVFLPPGLSGPFTIVVTAANILSDGVPGNADAADQDFALVVYNGQMGGVAGGGDHTLVLKFDGTVWAWGYNHYGQLGNGTLADSTVPNQVVGLGDVIAIAAGGYHSLALKSDGTVWAWGWNGRGQLGNGTTSDSGVPIQVPWLTNVVAIAAGTRHSLALTLDDTVWAWGGNDLGQLGNGTTNNSSAPVQVQGIFASGISAGGEHSHALSLSEGKVLSWGYNQDGELGIGTRTSTNVPVQVPGLTGVRTICAGWDFTLALKSDGTTWAWGDNIYGELGQSPGVLGNWSTVPVMVGMGGATSAACGWHHTVALRGDGTVWTWGANTWGQLGNGFTTDNPTPAQVGGLTNMVAVGAGAVDSFALGSVGAIWAWGDNPYGELGNGASSSGNDLPNPEPIQVTGLTVSSGPPPSSLHVILSPAVAANGGAQWQVDNQRWLKSGDILAGLSLGDHTVHFSTIPGWISPPDQTVTIVGGQTELAASYLQPAGSIQVTIGPPGAVNAGAQWQVLGVDAAWQWHNSGYLKSGLIPGTNYTVRFTAISGWASPPDKTVNLSAGPASLSAAYVEQFGSLQVMIQPDLANSAGAQWQLDALTWHRSGDIVPNLSQGFHTIHFNTISGWDAPRDQSVTITNGLMTISAGYRLQVGAVQVLISPACAVSAGAQWQVDGGAWQNSGDTVTNLIVGAHVVGYKQILPWPTPSDQSVMIADKETLTTNADYILPGASIGLGGDLAFGTVQVGTTATRTLVITNSGTVPLTVGGLTCPIGFAGAWSGTIAPGACQAVTIAFAPPAIRPYRGTISVCSDADPGTNCIALSGTGGGASISTGGYHVLAAKSDGTVWTWGYNGEGELGNGTTTDSYVPTQVPGLTGVLAVAAGLDHSAALKSDGTVWAWGRNNLGQLGNGTTTDSLVPAPVPGLSNVVAISAGNRYTVALKSNGAVWAWGANGGLLGDGTTTNRLEPVHVSGLSGIVAVSASFGHTVALAADGTVWAWGRNCSGELGNGTTQPSYVPVQVIGLWDVAAVAGGGTSTRAVCSDGTLWEWGQDWEGQMGISCNWVWGFLSLAPVQVGALPNVVTVASGSDFGIALKPSGTLWAWGSNNYGELGDGTTTNFTYNPAVPGRVLGLTNVVAVATSGEVVVALQLDGSVWAWGDNSAGQLGNGTSCGGRSCPNPVPVPVLGLSLLGGATNMNPVIHAVLSGHTLTLSVPTLVGHTYTLQYKNSLTDLSWTPLETQSGTGAPATFNPDTTANPNRFYRMVVQ